MTLSQRVEELTETYLNDSKRSIGEFVLREKLRIREYSTQQIAEQTYTSKAAVVRFAKALGFDGWKDFAKAYVSEQHYQQTHYSNIDPNLPFAADSSTRDIIAQMQALRSEALADTAELLSPHTVERVVDRLVGANRIALFGMSPNSFIGELFRQRMLTIGRLVEIPALGDSGLLAAFLTERDCAIIISYSGNSRNHVPLNTLAFLEPKGVPVIAITSRGGELSAQARRLHPVHLLPGKAVQQNLHLRHGDLHPLHFERAVLRLLPAGV